MELPWMMLGKNEKSVYLKGYDTYQMGLICGGTGAGKTGLLESMIRQFAPLKCAKIVFDPGYDLAEKAFALLKGKAVYISNDTPVSVNPMADEKLGAAHVVEIFEEGINQMTTSDKNQNPLSVQGVEILNIGVRECLKRSRRSLLHVRDWIANSNQGSTVSRDAVLSRLNYLLLTDEKMERILCSPNSLNIPEMIQGGKSIIFSGHGMRVKNSRFTGTIITQLIRFYFRLFRPRRYQPCIIIMDECQDFLSVNCFDVLKQGRKYQIALFAATQDLAVIDPKLASVLLNSGTLVCFRSGYDLASRMGRELRVSAGDIMELPKYHAFYRTPEEFGLMRTMRPPLVKKMRPKRLSRKPVQPKWFELRPTTPDSPAASQENLLPEEAVCGVKQMALFANEEG